ncbi:hypothetical protein MLD38_003870 [Melastoma candidum]|uniref:Uncharacterized protein n=1 Tax=Melastoma candidum TaxID=119954 RepID=A0ACB9SCF4_9MYRT|nr:hypothetical protein MLD38_003870 [Melastoma candidum]
MGTSESDHQPPPMGIPVASIPVPPPGMSHQDPQTPPTLPWSTDICGCFPDHFGRFCISFWCPCYTFGQISEIVDRGSSSCGVNGAIYFLLVCVTGCACFYSLIYRMKMRKQFALEGGNCQDCLLHFCCEACALTQEYQELKNRGFDPSLGWTGNAGRQDRGVVMAPIVEQGMNREM